jgi:hypothetical protein
MYISRLVKTRILHLGLLSIAILSPSLPCVTDLQGPPSERMQTEKLQDLKKLAQHYARDWGSCDDTRISYLEFLESEAEDDLTLARMISG